MKSSISIKILLFSCLLILLESCSIGFKGTSIPVDVKKFVVATVTDNSFNAPANYPNEFQIALTNKIRRESKLILDDKNPDVTFQCNIATFNVSSQAPVSGATSALNRLEIAIKVDATYANDETKNWSRTFSRFTEFAAESNFSTVENQLTAALNKLLTEDIFIASFSNW